MLPERGGPAAGDGQQHYESFIVRVRFHDNGSIRDTRMEHVRTGEVRRWAGWEHHAMLGFVREAAAPAALPVLLAAPVGPPDAEPHPESVLEPVAGATAADGSPPGLPAPIVRLQPDRTLLRTGQPFAVTLSLDLTKVAPSTERFSYSAVIVARQLGGRSARTLASPRGLAKAADTINITIDAGRLPPGIYLLEAAVSLRAVGASRAGAAAMAEGIMLQILPA
jgi:hypothetical protein